MKLVVSCLLLGLAAPLPTPVAGATQSAPTDDPLAVAATYLEAYERLDGDALEPFWTDASVWQDPTGGEIGASTAPVTGAANIRAHLASITAGLEDLELDVPERFTSGGQVVCIGTLRYVLPVQAPDGNLRRVPFSMKTVVILEVRDGKVLRHTDYADFRTWNDQYRAGLR